MNRTEKEFLDELKDLCRKYNVTIVEDWDYNDADGACFNGQYFDGDDISIEITEDLI